MPTIATDTGGVGGTAGDVKPGNILIDSAGRSHLVDFGLALKEADFGTGRRTPALRRI